MTPRIREIPDLDPLAWLAARPFGERFYWQDRRGNEFAALGSVARPATFEEAQRLLDSPDRVIVGALDFDAAAEPWPGFARCGLRVPRILIRKTAEATRQYLFHPEDEFEETPAAALKGLPSLAYHRTDLPDAAGWAERVNDALAHIERGEFMKVVPARRTRLELSEAPDPFALLAALKKITPNCFHFLIEGEGGCWLGASPEMLYSRRGRSLQTEAVAGTRARGSTPEEDVELGATLSRDLKESEEHAAVVGMIRDTLEKFSDRMAPAGPRHLLKLARVQHLITEFSADLRPRIGDADLLRALHPTPATCGLHVVAAREWIQRQEPFSRGYYAGPVGWMSSAEACFAVGLRSALLRDSTLELFAGAGIVRGSRPEHEWRELNSKIGDWLSLFES